MKILKLNNLLLFFIAAYTPFYSTFNKGPLKFFYFKNLYIAFILYYFIATLVENRRLTVAKPGKLTIYVISFFAIQVLSGFFAFDVDLAFQKIYVEFQFIAIFLVVNSLIVNDKSYEYIFKGLLAGFLIACVIAVLQYLGFKQFYLFTENELNGNAGLIHEERSTAVFRIWGTFGNSLGFSEYLCIVGIALYSYFRMLKKKTFIAIVIIAVALYCISLTVSRTALVATPVALLVMEFAYAGNKSSARLIYIIGALAVIFIGAFILSSGMLSSNNPIVNRLVNAGSDFKEGRLNLWIKGFQAFTQNVFLGVGPGNLHLALSSEGFPMTADIISQYDGQHVENYYLTMLYTYGIIGFYFILQIWITLVKYSYKLMPLLKGRINFSAYGGLMLGAIVAFLICNLPIPALVSDERIKMLYILIIAVVNNSFMLFNKNNLTNGLPQINTIFKTV